MILWQGNPLRIMLSNTQKADIQWLQTTTAAAAAATAQSQVAIDDNLRLDRRVPI